MRGHLGRIEDLRPAIMAQGRRLLLQSPIQHSVQLSRGHASAGLLMQMLSQVQHRLYVLPVLGSDEGDGNKLQTRKSGADVLSPFARGHWPHQVPLIDNKD